MYGSGGGGSGSSSINKTSLQEMMERDFNYSLEEMGLLLQVAGDLSPPGSSKSLEDFMLEDLNSCSGDEGGCGSGGDGFLFGEEGFEEFGMRFDNRSASDPIDIFDNFDKNGSSSNSSSNNKTTSTTSNVKSSSAVVSNNNNVSTLPATHHHHNNNNNSKPTNNSGSNLTSGGGGSGSAVIGVSKSSNLHKAVSVSINGKVSKVVVNNGSLISTRGSSSSASSVARHILNNNINNGLIKNSTQSSSSSSSTNHHQSSIYVWNGISFLNRSSEGSKGISFEESLGIMVSPKSKK
jgi:hypothetical protein